MRKIKSSKGIFLAALFPLIILALLTGAVNRPAWESRPDLEKYYREQGVTGSFLLYDLKNDRTIVFNPERTRKRFIPASTFKIFNSLVALETGVLKDEHAKIAWDGKKRGIAAWDRDHDLRSAFANSVVWYFQEAARRIGEKRMKRYLASLRYGNGDISGGIDMFWLEGGLRVSQEEQVDFLRRMVMYRLPLSRRSVDMVKGIMLLEEKPGYKLSGKTGLAMKGSPRIGWFVGFLERGGNLYFFANNIEKEDPGPSFPGARVEITKNILKHLELM